MNFELNEQQLSIQKMAREFTEKKVAPKVLERDETRVYDVELYQELSRMGFIGLPYAKEYGGQGLGYLEYAIAIEEISKVDPSLSVPSPWQPLCTAAACTSPRPPMSSSSASCPPSSGTATWVPSA